ncbi:hypothetical protein RB201_32430 [Streptomyces sp. S1A(2023)]
MYTFGFDDDRSFALVGTDGGLLAAPASMNRIQLSPGERAEVVVTVRPGERTVLRSYPWRGRGRLGAAVQRGRRLLRRTPVAGRRAAAPLPRRPLPVGRGPGAGAAGGRRLRARPPLRAPQVGHQRAADGDGPGRRDRHPGDDGGLDAAQRRRHDPQLPCA